MSEDSTDCEMSLFSGFLLHKESAEVMSDKYSEEGVDRDITVFLSHAIRWMKKIINEKVTGLYHNLPFAMFKKYFFYLIYWQRYFEIVPKQTNFMQNIYTRYQLGSHYCR